MPAMGATLEEKRRYEERFNTRAAYRYSRHARPDVDGTTRWQSPFAAGRLRSEQLPATMRNARKAPLVVLPEGARPPATINVAAADLPLQQRFTAGTVAHSISMSRRNAVEGVNGEIKGQFTSIDRGFIRQFRTEKIAFLLTFSLAGYNVRAADSFRRLIQATEEWARAPRHRAKRRKGTYDDVLGSGATSSAGSDQSPARAPPAP